MRERDEVLETLKKRRNRAIKKAWAKYPNPNDSEKRKVYILDQVFGT